MVGPTQLAHSPQGPTPMTAQRFARSLVLGLLVSLAAGRAHAQKPEEVEKYLKEHYTRQEHRIPMRDGARLFTAVYAPKDTSRKYPLLMTRTPYSVGPYGKDRFRALVGPSMLFVKAGYIFVLQAVRGCFRSEGTFIDMRP